MTEPGDGPERHACSDLTLPAAPSSPRAARGFLADTLVRWHVTAGVVDLAVLLTSELVTNAVRYGRGRVRLRVQQDPPSVRVQVHDDNPRLPVMVAEDDESAESGRGLRLVDALATRWGAEQSTTEGKDVWFEIDLREG